MKTAILVTGVLTLAGAAAFVDNEAAPPWRTALYSEEPQQRSSAAKSALGERTLAVRAALDVLQRLSGDADRAGTVRDAMELLGKMRAVEAVPILVEHLTVSVFYKASKRPQLPDDLYPAVGALIDIGVPSIEPVVAKAAGTDDPKVLRCAGLVVRGVLGDAMAQAYLSLRVDAEPDQARKQPLQRLANVLPELRRTYGPADFGGKLRTR